jgi:hypothetical protein
MWHSTGASQIHGTKIEIQTDRPHYQQWGDVEDHCEKGMARLHYFCLMALRVVDNVPAPQKLNVTTQMLIK